MIKKKRSEGNTSILKYNSVLPKKVWNTMCGITVKIVWNTTNHGEDPNTGKFVGKKKVDKISEMSRYGIGCPKSS